MAQFIQPITPIDIYYSKKVLVIISITNFIQQKPKSHRKKTLQCVKITF